MQREYGLAKSMRTLSVFFGELFFRGQRSVLPLWLAAALIATLVWALPGRTPPQVAQARPLYAPVPSVSLSMPDPIMLGEDFTFTATFENPGSTGYGPFIDMVFPVNGADGAAGTQTPDGIDFVSATYLGVAVETRVLTFDASGNATHPYARDAAGNYWVVTGTPGDKLVVMRLPFGSVVAGQPPIDVKITAHMSNLADLGTAQHLKYRGGFMFGSTALDDWCCDPVLADPAVNTSNSWPDQPVNPQLISLSKEYIGPEEETATGPNYLRRFRILVDVASGQTITNLEVTDLLANNIAYHALTSSSPASTAVATPTIDAPANPPNNELTRRFASVTGGPGNNDAVIEFSFFVPYADADGNPVLVPGSGGDVLIHNQADLEGSWTPVDGRDPVSTATAGIGIGVPMTHKSIAIQKGVENDTDTNNSPGDVLKYTLEFQVSDFFGLQDIVIEDILSDGLRFDTSRPPTLQIAGNQFTLPAAAMNAANYSEDLSQIGNDSDPATDGSTRLTFRVSDELISRSRPNGWMIGGCVPVAADGASGGTGAGAPDCDSYNNDETTGTLVFYAIIQEEFTDTYDPGDPSVDQGDALNNDVTVTGTILNNPDLSATANQESDTSGAAVNIKHSKISKDVYAINGSTSFSTPIKVTPQDTVTYRIKYELPTSDFENLLISDYLPLPVFSSSEITTFSNTQCGVPTAGNACLGPLDTYHTLTNAVSPSFSASGSDNSLTFDYGDYDYADNPASVIDLLFTVTVRPDPFADKLFLTNQAHAQEGSTNSGTSKADGIVQIELTEPYLVHKKGVVASDNPAATYNPTTPGPVSFTAPGSAGIRWGGVITSQLLATTPINSNISGVDGGDLVSFALVVENQGTSGKGAFDIRLKEVLPAGFLIPPSGAGLNLSIYNGAGDPVSYTDLGGGLFGNGIELNDPGTGTGVCQAHTLNSGNNIAIIIYDLMVDPSVAAGTMIQNVSTLFNYAGTEGGPDFTGTTSDLTDTAQTTISNPLLTTKTLTGTEINNTANNNTQAVIGEFLTYQISLTMGEGLTPNLRVIDMLDTGLALVQCDSITTTGGVTTDAAGGFAGACSSPTYNAGTRQITFNLGNVTNADNDADAETIVITYRTVVTNVAANQQGTQRRNSARAYWGTSGSSPTAMRAANVRILEPQISTAKVATINGGTSGFAGQTVNYTLCLRHPGTAASAPCPAAAAVADDTDAFDVTVSDPLPKGSGGDSLVLGPSFAVNDSAGTVTAADFELVGSDAAGWTLQTKPGVSFDFPRSTSRVIKVTISGTLSSSAIVGSTITNTATSRWSSLDGEPGQRSTLETNSTERTGSGTAPNDYVSTGSGSFTVTTPTTTKVITGTDQAFTADAPNPLVAVGERIHYRVTYSIPQGTAYRMRLIDTLDPGLAFVSCDSITADPKLSSSLSPQFSCANASFNTGGSIMTLPLGNVVNSDTDAGHTEYLVIDYTVVVLNAATVNRGSTHNNTALLEWYTAATGGTRITVAGSAPDVTVLEPELHVTKTLQKKNTGDPGDAGDEYIVTIDVQHTASSNTDAYNVVWNDPLPAGMVYTSGTLTQVSGPAVTLDPAAPAPLTATWASFPQGASAQLQFEVTLAQSVLPDETITNTTNVTYTSLPGDVSTPLSTYNNQSIERSGDTSQACCSTANDYRHQTSAQVTIGSPTFAKSLASSSAVHTTDPNVTIGEVVTYDLVVTLPESTAGPFEISDNIPLGMDYVDGSLLVVPGTFNGTFNGGTVSGGAGNGDDVTFHFDSVVTTADDDITNNSFTLRYQALVLNEASNTGQPATTLSNRASLQIGSGPVYEPTPVDLTVVEPKLEISKAYTTNTAGVNDPVEITLTVRNTGSSDAYEIALEDALPKANFDNVALTTTPPDFTGTVVDTVTAWTVRYTSNGAAPLPPGEMRTFVFTAKVIAINDGDVLTNTASITQATTLPGSDLNERDEPDSSGSDDLTGIAPNLALDKDDGLTTVQPGNVIVYTLTVSNIGTRRTDGVTLTETVPANTTFNATGSLPYVWSCADGALPGTTCTVTLPGEVLVGDVIPVKFAVRLNRPLADGITNVVNSASVADSGTHGTDPIANNSDNDDDTITANPAPDGVKSFTLIDANGNGLAEPGEKLEYTLIISNRGDRDATAMILTDAPDPHTTLDVGSVTTTLGTVEVGNTAGDSTVRVNIGTLVGDADGAAPYDGTVTIVFRATIQSPLAAGVTLVENEGQISGGNFTTVNTNTVQTPVEAAPDLEITKTDGGAGTTPRSVVVYTLSYRNKGNQNATGVTLTETVPANSTFEAASSTAGWSCAPNNNAGSTCTYAVGNLTAGAAPASVNFAVRTNSPVPAAASELSNTASIDDDHGNGSEPTPSDNTSTDTTPITATPAPDGVKSFTLIDTNGNGQAEPGEKLEYTIIISNRGDRDAADMILTDAPDPHTTLDVGSVTTTLGTVEVGNTAGDSTVRVNIGTLAGDADGAAPYDGTVTIVFRATIHNPLETGVTLVENEGQVSGSNFTTFNTNTVQTPITAAPDLEIVKADGGVTAVPGNVITYTLDYRNKGNQNATGVVLTEIVPANTTFDAAGSTAGWICAPNNNPGSTCTYTVAGAVVAGDPAVTVNFALRVNDPIPASVNQISNTASIDDDHSNGTEPTPADNSDTELTPLDATAQPDGVKSFTLIDANGNGLAEPGEKLEYTIIISNHGDRDAADMILTDAPDPHTTLDVGSVTTTLGTVEVGNTAGDSTVRVNIGTLVGDADGAAPYDGTVTIVFRATIQNPLPAGIDLVENEGAVSGSNFTTVNTNTVQTPVEAAPDLEITKTDNDLTAEPGDTVVYVLGYRNKGNQDATGVTITEVVSANTTFNAASSSAGWSCAPDGNPGSTCTYTIGNLAAGAPAVNVNFAVTVNATLPAGVIELNNTASIDDDHNNGTEPTPTDNTASDTTPLTAAPDLEVVKTDHDASGAPRGTITYELTYRNKGDQGATGVTLTETVPANTSYSGSGWTCAPDNSAGSTCTYTLPAELSADPASNTGTVNFVVTVVSPLSAGVTQTSNTASIDDDHGNGTEPTPADNTSTDTTPLNATAQPDGVKSFTLIDANGNGLAEPGEKLEYTIIISNHGDRDATDMILTDAPDPHTTLDVGSVSTTLGTVEVGNTAGDSTVRVNIGTLVGDADGAAPYDGTVTIVFRATIQNPLPAGIDLVENEGQVSGSNFTTVNTNTVQTPIEAAPDLEITKTDNDLTAKPGDTVVYVLGYRNKGNQDATGVTITEVVSANTTFNAASSSAGWSCAPDGNPGSTCTYTIGNLAAGAPAVNVNFAVTVDDTLPAGVIELNNTASIDDDHNNGTEPTPTDNTASDSTPLTAAPDLEVVKTDHDASGAPSGTITYELTYRNKGNQGATGVTLTETVPANTSYSGGGWTCAPDNSAGSTCTYTLPAELSADPASNTGTVNFVVTVVNPLPAGVTQTSNTATVDDDHSNGAEPTPADNTGSDTTPLNAVPDLTITKTDGVDAITQNMALVYALTYQNVGGKNATGVMLHETVPALTTFDALNSTPGWKLASNTALDCPNNAPAGTQCVFPVSGEVVGGAPAVTVNFAVQTLATFPTPAPDYSINLATITDDETNGEDPTDEGDATNNNSSVDENPVVDGGIGDSGDMTKTLTDISPTPPGSLDDRIVTIGHTLTYTLRLNIPAGANFEDMQVTDILDRGLAFGECQSITVDPVDSATDLTIAPNTLDAVCSGRTVSTYPDTSTNPADPGRQVVFDFGSLGNSSAEVPFSIVIRYTAIVLDSSENQGETKPPLSLNNSATWSWRGGGKVTTTAPGVRIIEPDLRLAKSIRPSATRAGAVVTVTLTVSHPKSSQMDAYDVVLHDPLPEGLTYYDPLTPPTCVRGVCPEQPDYLTYDPLTDTVRIRWDTFPRVDPAGSSTLARSVIQFRATFNPPPDNTPVINTANVEWTSLPGDHQDPKPTPDTASNPLAHERWYDPASPGSVYRVEASARVRVGRPGSSDRDPRDDEDSELQNLTVLPSTGFAPGEYTVLPEQPLELQYQALGNLWLEVPSLGIKQAIVGVPLAEEEWDLTWLSNQIGYLEGTAFPSWVGNSALTAHVYNADGTAGPFVNLNTLKWGDKIILHAYGSVYTYEVRDVLRVAPDDFTPLQHEDLSWLTLLTCQGYNASEGSYDWRVAVRAVLISSQAE